MKNYLTYLLLLFASYGYGQKLKITYEPSVFSSRWTLDGKVATEQEVKNYLKTIDPNTYYDLQEASTADKTALGISITGLGLVVAALFVKKPAAKWSMMGGGLLLTFASVPIATGSEEKRNTALQRYATE